MPVFAGAGSSGDGMGPGPAASNPGGGGSYLLQYFFFLKAEEIEGSPEYLLGDLCCLYSFKVAARGTKFLIS